MNRSTCAMYSRARSECSKSMARDHGEFTRDCQWHPSSVAGRRRVAYVARMRSDAAAAPRSATIEKLAHGVRGGDRRALAKAITLVESTRASHQEQAQRLLELLLPHTGEAARVGVSGVPGVGKSTFIEAFGLYLIAHGKRVAVLAVDPSSARSGG